MLAPMAEQETVTIREGIKRLEDGSLAICTSMTTLNLPSSLEYITGRAFPSIPSTRTIETINIPESNEYYKAEDGYIYSKDGTELVYVVSTKTEVNINEKIETIKDHAIYCLTITELTIPDNVITIEGNAIRTCNSLKKIEIGSGLSNLSSTFKANSVNNLESIIIDEENQNYKISGNLILTKDGKEVVTYIKRNVQSQIIPEGVEKLCSYAFANLTNVIEIILPSTLKEIESSAFYNCTGLSKIAIPSSVEIIGTNAFGSCSNLAEIRIDKEQGSISGSPWSAPKGERSIIWLR